MWYKCLIERDGHGQAVPSVKELLHASTFGFMEITFITKAVSIYHNLAAVLCVAKISVLRGRDAHRHKVL